MIRETLSWRSKNSMGMSYLSYVIKGSTIDRKEVSMEDTQVPREEEAGAPT